MKAIFCLVNNEAQAQRLVDRLLATGFSPDAVSILSPDKTVRTSTGTTPGQFGDQRVTSKKGTLGTEKHTKAPEGGVVGATTGGILGGSIGLLAGLGALAIPGLGPFIAAGPIVAALSGSAIGGSLGLLIGSLVGAGIPEYEAKKYQAGLKAGNILISVHTDNNDQINKANDIMKKEGAKEISTTSEKTTSRGY